MMSNLLQNCCVCVGNNEGLINISATDKDEIQWRRKLNICVPEVDWSYEYVMCSKCAQQLEIAFSFYNLCLQSYTLRRQQAVIPEPKIEAEDVPETSVLKDETLGIIRNSPKIHDIEMKTEEFSTNEEKVSSSDEEFSSTEEEAGGADSATLDSLPNKTRRVYEKNHSEFYEWLEKNTINTKCITENLLLAYFSELSEIRKTSSLLTKYSMLKTTLKRKENIDIKKFKKLSSFLKRKSRGYKAKKTKGFTRHEIINFLRDAPDAVYLMKKVVMIVGIAGGCACEELTYLEMDNIQDVGSALLITVKDAAKKIRRSFKVVNSQDPNFPDLLNIYRKYIELRPLHTPHKRLFVQYIKGKCTTLVVGIHTIAKIPSQIAEYLNLPEPLTYTGHSLRRTSTSISVL